MLFLTSIFLIVFKFRQVISSIDVSCIKDGFPSTLCNTTFSDPEHLKSDSDDIIHIGVTLKIIRSNNEYGEGFNEDFKKDIETFLTQMMQLYTEDTLHLILITDTRSVTPLNNIIRNIISKHLTNNIIATYPGRRRSKKVPKVIVDYVDLDKIATTSNQGAFISSLKSFLFHNSGTQKYADKLFYVAPLYHQIFPSLKKLVFMDVDLTIQVDMKTLYQQLSEFSEHHVIGVGYDLSPHYRLNLEQFRKWNPDSLLGEPGSNQGFNTGVVLFNLEKMRNSDSYNSYLHPGEVNRIMKKYGYHLSLGDQDWFTNIGFEAPDLFYRLPCQFNAQVSVQYWRPPWEDVFEKYHHCDKPYHIIHKNGCGPTREVCDKILKSAGME